MAPKKIQDTNELLRLASDEIESNREVQKTEEQQLEVDAPVISKIDNHEVVELKKTAVKDKALPIEIKDKTIAKTVEAPVKPVSVAKQVNKIEEMEKAISIAEKN